MWKFILWISSQIVGKFGFTAGIPLAKRNSVVLEMDTSKSFQGFAFNNNNLLYKVVGSFELGVFA